MVDVRGRVARIVIVAGMTAAAVVLGAGAAAAQSGESGLDRDDQIVLNGRLAIPSDQSVRSAVILNGPARIDGTVRETLFVLNGRVDIAGTVGQDVIVVNGAVVIRSSAHVGGDVVTRTAPTIERGATIDGELQSVATRFDAPAFGVASRLVWWVGYSASTLFLGLLLLLLFPALDGAAVRVWRDRAGEAVGFGAAVFFLLPVAALIFLLTIVGIPLGLFLVFGLALVYTAGYVAGAHVLGRLIVKPPTTRFLAFLVGWGILRVVALVPVLGGFVWLIVSLIGLGVLTAAARRAGTVATPSAPTPPAPPPPAPVLTG
jgi:cytoskeletal protein CcmA (bactofilin family)